MADGTQIPSGIDPRVATAARMYNYFLGGHDNFAADRIAALKVIEAAPEAPFLAKENRKFLGRAVRFLAAEAGIGQLLDLGTGLPARGNVHEVARQVNPSARTIYVDNDPMVLAHSKALKTGAGTAVIRAEMHLQAVEACLDAGLHLGRHAEVVAEPRQHTAARPFREQLHGMLMLALYRDGRQAEALATYRRARRLLVGELGVEPGADLRGLHERILAGDLPCPSVIARARPTDSAASAGTLLYIRSARTIGADAPPWRQRFVHMYLSSG